MPSVITVSDVTWLTPEGRALFTGLNLSFAAERAGLVGRNGVGKTTLLKLVSGELSPFSGKVAVSGTLGMLRQTVQVGAAETIVYLFGVAEQYAIFRHAFLEGIGITRRVELAGG
ncbi:MAG: ATP-binding cassette domain-containing protein [Verrucomicrobiaceae bacterium]|nr:MAG: ATP-binding cassette domain-containing protein [Verrucomicrobiaceae bacterium]